MSVQSVDLGVTRSIGENIDSYFSSFGRIDLWSVTLVEYVGSRSRRTRMMVARLLTFCNGSKDCC